MSIAIELDTIEAVLLADGWHTVSDASFDVDAYEFVHGRLANGDPQLIYNGGSQDSAAGFVFHEEDDELGTAGGWLAGPLSAIVAVRFRRRSE